MHFAMKNGQICVSLRKFLAISPAIQKIASDCGCDAVVHLVLRVLWEMGVLPRVLRQIGGSSSVLLRVLFLLPPPPRTLSTLGSTHPQFPRASSKAPPRSPPILQSTLGSTSASTSKNFPVGTPVSGTKHQPKEEVFLRSISHRYPRFIAGKRPGSKTSVRPSKPRKNKHYSADIHDPGQVQGKLQGFFSFPIGSFCIKSQSLWP